MQHYFSRSIRTAVQYAMVIIASAAAPPLLYGVWLLARVFLVDYFTIPTKSMCPTLLRHQFRHDYYFMAGDNVVNSADSRYWGLVPEEYVIGVMEWAVRDKKIHRVRDNISCRLELQHANTLVINYICPKKCKNRVLSCKNRVKQSCGARIRLRIKDLDKIV